MFVIKNVSMLNKLIKAIAEDEGIVEKIKFKDEFLKDKLFKALDIAIQEFETENHIIKENIYIAESEQGYFVISNMGFVCYRETFFKKVDKMYTSYEVQNEVIMCLIREVKKLLKKKDVYDIDSYNNEKLSKISLAIFNNLLFYFELFGKCYLLFNNIDIGNEHELKKIFKEVKKEMSIKEHNNTLFNVMIMEEIEKIVKYISSIPGEFKEQYVKYNDNNNDCTIVLIEQINQIENLIEISFDFITQMKYDKNSNYYLKDGLYERLLAKCTNEEEKGKINKMYGHLIKKL